jgi:membrane-associated phospholipid phosphatase
MILPYFSIYPLFVLSFFACGDARELRAYSYRLSLCQLVAGVCYLMYPLECGFQRPAMDGVFGFMFRILDATDRPYNLAPSLHVATALIVGTVMTAKASVGLRALSAAWFVLIALSTLLTWQHHVVDVIAGATLGLACIRTFAVDCAPRT